MTQVSSSIKVTGLTPAQLKGKFRGAAEKGLLHIATQARTDAVRSILKGPKTGRVYEFEWRTINGHPVEMKSLPRVPHQASAPGEAPANDTGFLAGHIFAEPVKGELAARIVANALYAVDLEFGTSKMALFLDAFSIVERAPRTSDADLAFCREVRVKYGPMPREAQARERERASVATVGSFRDLVAAINSVQSA